MTLAVPVQDTLCMFITVTGFSLCLLLVIQTEFRFILMAQSNRMIGCRRANNRAAREAPTLVHFFEVD